MACAGQTRIYRKFLQEQTCSQTSVFHFPTQLTWHYQALFLILSIYLFSIVHPPHYSPVDLSCLTHLPRQVSLQSSSCSWQAAPAEKDTPQSCISASSGKPSQYQYTLKCLPLCHPKGLAPTWANTTPKWILPMRARPILPAFSQQLWLDLTASCTGGHPFYQHIHSSCGLATKEGYMQPTHGISLEHLGLAST